MPKYQLGKYFDDKSVVLTHIANELAEANRLKRLELSQSLEDLIEE